MKNLTQKIRKVLKGVGIGLAALVGLGVFGTIHSRYLANPRRLEPEGGLFTSIINENWYPKVSPSWSRDGKIAYWQKRDGTYTLTIKSGFKKNADTLTIDGYDDLNFVNFVPRSQKPCWSPDSNKIAVMGVGLEGSYKEIYDDSGWPFLEIRTTSATKNKSNQQSDLVLTVPCSYIELPYLGIPLNDYIAWSRDGKYIAFGCGKSGKENAYRDIWIYELENKKSRPIINSEDSLEIQPCFSPDGRAIVFASNRSGNYDIWIKYLESGKEVQITKDEADDTQPDWSPDGKWIVFTSNRNGNRELYLTNPEGSIEERLTCNRANDTSPSWDHDSRKIAFQSDRGIVMYERWRCSGSSTTISKEPDIWIYDLENILGRVERRLGEKK